MPPTLWYRPPPVTTPDLPVHVTEPLRVLSVYAGLGDPSERSEDTSEKADTERGASLGTLLVLIPPFCLADTVRCDDPAFPGMAGELCSYEKVGEMGEAGEGE